MNRVERQQAWRTRIENYRASGQTMVAWSKANNHTIHELKYWLKQIEGPPKSKRSKSASTFIPVIVPPSPVRSNLPTGSLRIHVGAASIELSESFDSTQLREVVKVLKDLC
ncbi:IS66 family insertion sequence element accessory protein TnpA [Paenibacillus sp. YYML68]|uniref:IS66 family insertion sequence element accessory protein TnpA n=1 Tax=Paenibacillus sp. YYML68 TaxID=2909250 RepID=UPI002492D807|nr:IS66 family insertion sequence element accessory protein TnpB [Paenibacillus sp. YYML68]